jgi:hypothetical protein
MHLSNQKLNDEDIKHINGCMASNENKAAVVSLKKEKSRSQLIHCQNLPDL